MAISEQHRNKISEGLKRTWAEGRHPGGWRSRSRVLPPEERSKRAVGVFESWVERSPLKALYGKRVKLSADGLLASAMRDRGFGLETRGSIVPSLWPMNTAYIAVLVDGAAEREHWMRRFWEVVEE